MDNFHVHLRNRQKSQEKNIPQIGTQQNRANRTFDEEDEYNRRREEELRKQVQKRDQEINSLNMAQNFLRNKIDKNMSQIQDQSKYASFGRQVPDRDFNDHTSRDQQVPQEFNPPNHVIDHINHLQSDNASLMRRLNLVLQELERVEREKEDLKIKIKSVQQETGNIQRLINGEDNIDKVNKYMQDDLFYERDRNNKLKQKLKDQEQYRVDLINELNKFDHNQEHMGKESSAMNIDLQKKLFQLQQLEEEHFYTLEKIKQLNEVIDQQRVEERAENFEIQDLQKKLNQMLNERNGLLEKQDILTQKYDQIVQDISRDREIIERRNRSHNQLVAAKILYQQVYQLKKQRVRDGFQEFKTYCSFDNNCHQKLQIFAKILETQGMNLQKAYLKIWYQNALKPIDTKIQSIFLSEKLGKDRLLAKMYYRWRSRYMNRLGMYDQKTKALDKFWQYLVNDAKSEMRRAFMIWKDKQLLLQQQKDKLKQLLYGQYFKRINRGFQMWYEEAKHITAQIRLTIMAKQLTFKQYKQLIWGNFKQQIFIERQKRRNRLFHYLKAWREYLSHKKYLRAAYLNILRTGKQLDTNLLKQCFDALKINKAATQFEMADFELNNEELQKIDSLTKQVADQSKKNSDKSAKTALKCLNDQGNKTLQSYFNKWKGGVDNYNEGVNTKIKGRILAFYYDQLRQAFNMWKKNGNQQMVQQSEMVMMEEQAQATELQNESINLQKDIQNKKEQLDCSSRKSTNKLLTKFFRRQTKQAFDRWKDVMGTVQVKESGAEDIIKRLRRRMLRNGFNQYKAGIQNIKKIEKDEDRSVYMRKTLDERMKRKIYRAWAKFKRDFTKSKDYWYRIYIRFDRINTEAFFKRWKENSRLKMEMLLQEEQNQNVEQLSELNKQIGRLNEAKDCSSHQNAALDKKLRSQAQRIISNAFANFYYGGTARSFEKWRQHTEYMRHRDSIMKKMIDRWRKHAFYHFKACFSNWMNSQKIEEKQAYLKKEEQKLGDTQFQYERQTNNFLNSKKHLNNELDQLSNLQRIYNSRLQKSVQMLIKKNDNNYFVSQKRYILQQWRDFVKRQKQFINQTKNVIQKSLWSIGFLHIKHFARMDQRNQKVDTKMNRFRMKFWKRTCGNAFSVWRSGAFKMITDDIQQTNMIANNEINKHNQMVRERKSHNRNKAYNNIKSQQLRNMFLGWKNVIGLYKLQNSKDEMFQDYVRNFQIRMGLLKWKARKDSTKLARLRKQRLRTKMQRIRLILVFNEMKKLYFNAKSFMSRMSNLANIHDHQALKLGYNAIISFSKAKQYVYGQRKMVSSKDLNGMLTNLLKRRMIQYFTCLKNNSLTHYDENHKKMYTVLKKMGEKMRQYFLRWKNRAAQESLKIELNEEGPIREEILNEKQKLYNYIDFMTKEGYTNDEIQEAIKQGNKRLNLLLQKGVGRLQHFNSELFGKPKYFDQWKSYVRMRKFFRYCLNSMMNKNDHHQCDIHHFFNKWKNFPQRAQNELRKLKKEQLQKIVINNANKMGHLADYVDQNEFRLKHLNEQREELVENYIKSQKLALTLWKNKNKQAVHRAFLRWYRNQGIINLGKLDQNVRKNLDIINQLKDRIKNLEVMNDSIGTENEELRQFSLDGYEIAKNVQVLSCEREKLSVDLADKAQTIRRLLDENEKLHKALNYAQGEAQKMINATKENMNFNYDFPGYEQMVPNGGGYKKMDDPNESINNRIRVDFEKSLLQEKQDQSNRQPKYYSPLRHKYV